MKKALAFLIVSVALTGCQMGQRNQAPNQPAKVQEVQRVPQTANENRFDQSPQATARRLTDIANRVPNVKGSTAIVFGKTAIIGINIDGKLDRSRVGTLKYTVAEALKKDPQGASAIVTADPDIVQRLKEMNQEIKNGHPISGFAQELADITGRLIPQLPRTTGVKK